MSLIRPEWAGLVGFGVNLGIPAKLFAPVAMTSMSTRAIFSSGEIWENVKTLGWIGRL